MTKKIESSNVASLYSEVSKKLEKNSDKRLFGLWSLIGQKVTCSNKQEKEDAIKAFSADPISYKLITGIIYCNLNATSIRVQVMPRESIGTVAEVIREGKSNGLILVAGSKFAATTVPTDNTINVLLWNLPE